MKRHEILTIFSDERPVSATQIVAPLAITANVWHTLAAFESSVSAPKVGLLKCPENELGTGGAESKRKATHWYMLLGLSCPSLPRDPSVEKAFDNHANL